MESAILTRTIWTLSQQGGGIWSRFMGVMDAAVTHK